jgi:hypothetical protein
MHVNTILGVDTQYTAKVKNLRNKFAQPMKTPGVNFVIKCVVLQENQSDKMYR